jgi:hypothetical protein
MPCEPGATGNAWVAGRACATGEDVDAGAGSVVDVAAPVALFVALSAEVFAALLAALPAVLAAGPELTAGARACAATAGSLAGSLAAAPGAAAPTNAGSTDRLGRASAAADTPLHRPAVPIRRLAQCR